MHHQDQLNGTPATSHRSTHANSLTRALRSFAERPFPVSHVRGSVRVLMHTTSALAARVGTPLLQYYPKKKKKRMFTSGGYGNSDLSWTVREGNRVQSVPAHVNNSDDSTFSVYFSRAMDMVLERFDVCL